MTDEQEIPILRFNNIFNVRDSTKKPVVDIVSIYGKEKNIIENMEGPVFTAEKLNINVKYQNEFAFYTILWESMGGLANIQLIEDKVLPDEYLNLNKITNIFKDKRPIRRNIQINDIFLHEKYPERRICHFTPCAISNEYSVLLQMFEKDENAPGRFILNLVIFHTQDDYVKLNCEKFSNFDELSKKYPRLVQKINYNYLSYIR